MNNINYFEQQNFDTVIIRKIPNFLFNTHEYKKRKKKFFYFLLFNNIAKFENSTSVHIDEILPVNKDGTIGIFYFYKLE